MKNLGLYTSTAVEDLQKEKCIEIIDCLEGSLIDNLLLYNSKTQRYFLCLEHYLNEWSSCYKVLECSEDEGYGQWETIAENNGKKGKIQMTIYLLFSSDIWKSTSSSNCVLVTTSIDKMQKGIALAIEKNIIEYGRGEQNLTIEEQILMFKKDCKENPEVVWDNLEYGYVEVREEGVLEC